MTLSPVGKRASAAPHALSHLEFFAYKHALDAALALDASRFRVWTETIDTHVTFLAFHAIVASLGVIKRFANFFNVTPAFLIDLGVLGFRFGRLALGGFRFLFFDLLRAAKQRGDVEVVQRQCVHHFSFQRRIFSEIFATKTRACLHGIRTQTLGALVKVLASLIKDSRKKGGMGENQAAKSCC